MAYGSLTGTGGCQFSARCSTMTVVSMPPRTLKMAVRRIKRGLVALTRSPKISSIKETFFREKEIRAKPCPRPNLNAAKHGPNQGKQTYCLIRTQLNLAISLTRGTFFQMPGMPRPPFCYRSRNNNTQDGASVSSPPQFSTFLSGNATFLPHIAGQVGVWE